MEKYQVVAHYKHNRTVVLKSKFKTYEDAEKWAEHHIEKGVGYNIQPYWDS